MSQSVANIHDAYFKQAIGDPVRPRRFLLKHLAAPPAALLSDQPPELLPGSFVDEGPGQHHSDLLFRVGLKSGTSAFAHTLMEHKIAPDSVARQGATLKNRSGRSGAMPPVPRASGKTLEDVRPEMKVRSRLLLAVGWLVRRVSCIA